MPTQPTLGTLSHTFEESNILGCCGVTHSPRPPKLSIHEHIKVVDNSNTQYAIPTLVVVEVLHAHLGVRLPRNMCSVDSPSNVHQPSPTLELLLHFGQLLRFGLAIHEV